MEIDSSGNYKSEFLYGPAGLISHDRAGLGTVFFAYDERGNVQSIREADGTFVTLRTYDAYGAKTGDYWNTVSFPGGVPPTSGPYTYDDPEVGYNGQSGYITDPETGLVICGHRYYDPANGRWLNRDPIGYSGGVNVYSYCTNNPVMGVDASGFATGAFGGGVSVIDGKLGGTIDCYLIVDFSDGDIGVGSDAGFIGGTGQGFSAGPQLARIIHEGHV